MIDPRLPEATRRSFAELAIDWRNAALIEIDGELRAHPAAVSESCGVAVLEPLALATVDVVLEPLRALPSHKSELISELRGGEFLTLLRREGEWALVQGEDGYVGWIADWNLREQLPGERESLLARYRGRFAAPRGTLWNSDHWAASALWRGTPLLFPDDDGVRERSGEHRVVTPWGAEGWLAEFEIEQPLVAPDEGELLRSATQQLGSPYRWGGRSAAGWDCSGFTQHCFAMIGIALARDAAQQASQGQAVDARSRDGWQRGDLLFFGEPADHVGIYDGRGAMLHASARVRHQSLQELEKLLRRLTGVRRIRRQDASQPTSLWLRS